MKATMRLAAAVAAAAVILTPGARQWAMDAADSLRSEMSREVDFALGRDSDQTLAAGSAPAPAAAAAPAPTKSTTQSKKASAKTKTVAPGALGFRDGATHYKFTASGPNGQPARWSSCEPVRIVINPAGAPKGAVADMKLALEKVRAATGLNLQVLGTTTAKSVPEWGYHQRGKWSGWAPVLISWGRPGGALNANASATTEPVWKNNSKGQAVFVSGQLRINIEHDDYYTPGFGSATSRVALYMHELGHVVGLDHVDDNHQLMFPSMGSTKDLGAGDLAGMAKAGKAGCVAVPTPSWN